jgi:hypothetical protein
MTDVKKIDMKRILEDNKKKIEEINILAQTEPIQALERIENDINRMPMGLVELVDELKKHDSQIVREKANEISKKIWDCKASMADAIVCTASKLVKGMELPRELAESYVRFAEIAQAQRNNMDFIKALKPSIDAIDDYHAKLGKMVQEQIKNVDLYTGLKPSIDAIDRIHATFAKIAQEQQRSVDAIALLSRSASIPEIIAPPIMQYPFGPSISTSLRTTQRNRLTKQDIIKREIYEIIANEEKLTSYLNVNAYRLLLFLERSIRTIIINFIIENPSGENCNKLPDGMWKEWVKKQEEEKSKGNVQFSDSPIDYSDFTDLAKILNRKHNKDIFSPHINQERFDGIILKIKELEPIRLKIAHSRVLTTDELNKLMMYTKDIMKLFNKLPGRKN